VFWSKIWFFLVAVAAALALTVALIMPRPAQRAAQLEEKRRLTVACGVVNIKLEDDARKRLELAGLFARKPVIEAELAAASAAATLDDARMKKARGAGEQVMGEIKGGLPPSFAILIDKKGRVVARVGVSADEYGDVMAGRPLVDDALAGYLRDDLWLLGGSLFFVTASPVIKDHNEYVGATVLGHKVSNELAKVLIGKSLLVELGFYRSGDTLAATESLAFDVRAMQQRVDQLKNPDRKTDCSTDNEAIELVLGGQAYGAKVARLPGEAGAAGAYFAVFAEKPSDKGFFATLDEITKGDLGFGNFPWLLVIGGFLAMLGVGIALMLLEADRPLRRLAADAVRLAKSETERLAEDAHPGKFGSIARSVNIHIDKLGREARSAKKDLDQLLGPAPEGSLGTIDLLATALPAVRPGGPAPAAPPPPSDFRFAEPTPRPARPGTPPPRPGTPPPFKAATPPPPIATVNTPPPSFDAPTTLGTPPPPLADKPPPLSLDDDILGGGGLDPLDDALTAVGEPGVDPYFKKIFDQFVATKQQCNEPTTTLTYEKFTEKLIKNRDDLMAKTGCRDVRFTVYVKEGKAALKATPVKDD
jgi:hypothetical protein